MLADEFQPLSEESKNLGGRPPHVPTEESREQVGMLSGYGLTHEQIAKFMGMVVETLNKHYSDELQLGRIKADVKVAGSIFRKAISDEHPQSMAAAKWWEQTRAGRREKQDVNHTGVVATYDAAKLAELSDEELVTLETVLTRIATGGSTLGRGSSTDSEEGR